jgi:hypothetical protein
LRGSASTRRRELVPLFGRRGLIKYPIAARFADRFHHVILQMAGVRAGAHGIRHQKYPDVVQHRIFLQVVT